MVSELLEKINYKAIGTFGFTAIVCYVLITFGMDQYEKTADNERSNANKAAESERANSARIAAATEKGAAAQADNARFMGKIEVAITEIATVSRTLEATNRVILASTKESREKSVETNAILKDSLKELTGIKTATKVLATEVTESIPNRREQPAPKAGKQ